MIRVLLGIVMCSVCVNNLGENNMDMFGGNVASVSLCLFMRSVCMLLIY